MFNKFRRKAATVLRYLFPTAGDRAYLAAMRSSGQFDRAYYLDSNPRLNPLFRLWPERHYVQLGEANGVCPNPGFSPRAYLFHNPDLGDIRQPLRHYIEVGRGEGRVVLAAPVPETVPQLPSLSPRSAPKAPVAVALHLYYPELWDEFAARLAAQRFDFDLYMTLVARSDLSQEETQSLKTQITAQFPKAQVWTLPNHGRDILPFLHLLSQGVFAPYRAVCKLHGKRSPHRADGDDWRQDLVCGVLGEPKQTEARLRAFLADPEAGIWVADGHLNEGNDWWGANRPRAEVLRRRAGMAPFSDPLRFPAGSIYWVRTEVLDALGALNLTAADFEPEQALVDGTTAHVIERLMGHIAEQAGRTLAPGSSFDAAGLDKAEQIGQ
ncbi:hypothetical protein N4R57_19945 [Rhodobacteraceae bacterium D3-12]|nr:hypothetical protein N4R57_19945 [Rhodobacteraceae bacterium D3-12]